MANSRDTKQIDGAAETVKKVADETTRAGSDIARVGRPQVEEFAWKSSQNIEEVREASSVLAKGAQEISREWFDAVRERFVENLEALNRIAGCRSLQELVTVQTEIVRDGLGQTVNSSRRIAEASIRVTKEAARIVQSREPKRV